MNLNYKKETYYILNFELYEYVVAKFKKIKNKNKYKNFYNFVYIDDINTLFEDENLKTIKFLVNDEEELELVRALNLSQFNTMTEFLGSIMKSRLEINRLIKLYSQDETAEGAKAYGKAVKELKYINDKFNLTYNLDMLDWNKKYKQVEVFSCESLGTYKSTLDFLKDRELRANIDFLMLYLTIFKVNPLPQKYTLSNLVYGNLSDKEQLQFLLSYSRGVKVVSNSANLLNYSFADLLQYDNYYYYYSVNAPIILKHDPKNIETTTFNLQVDEDEINKFLFKKANKMLLDLFCKEITNDKIAYNISTTALPYINPFHFSFIKAEKDKNEATKTPRWIAENAFEFNLSGAETGLISEEDLREYYLQAVESIIYKGVKGSIQKVISNDFLKARLTINPEGKLPNTKRVIAFSSSQSTGKTTFFTELGGVLKASATGLSLENFKDRDNIVSMMSVLWVELGEISKKSFKDVNNFKSIYGQGFIYQRPLFKDYSINFPIGFSCDASTNDTKFLRDETGSDRYTIVLLDKQIKFNALWKNKGEWFNTMIYCLEQVHQIAMKSLEAETHFDVEGVEYFNLQKGSKLYNINNISGQNVHQYYTTEEELLNDVILSKNDIMGIPTDVINSLEFRRLTINNLLIELQKKTDLNNITSKNLTHTLKKLGIIYEPRKVKGINKRMFVYDSFVYRKIGIVFREDYDKFMKGKKRDGGNGGDDDGGGKLIPNESENKKIIKKEVVNDNNINNTNNNTNNSILYKDKLVKNMSFVEKTYYKHSKNQALTPYQKLIIEGLETPNLNLTLKDLIKNKILLNNKLVFFDFETYSDVDLKTADVKNYVNSPSFRVLCTSYISYNSNLKIIKFDEEELLSELNEEFKNADKIIAHNIFFDAVVWNDFVCKKYPNFTKIPVNKMFDTMYLCNFYRLPASLKEASKHLDLSFKKFEGGDLIIKTFIDVLSTKKRELEGVEWDLMYNYNLYDVLSLVELYDKLAVEYPESEELVMKKTLEINLKGLPVDEELIEKLIEVGDKATEFYNEKLTNLSDGKLTKVSELQKIKNYVGWEDKTPLNDNSYNLVKNNFNSKSREIIECRLDGSSNTINRPKSILNKVYNGRVYNVLNYHFALTGRWSSRGMQTQNLSRSNFSSEDIDYILKNDINIIMEEKNPIKLIKSVLRGIIKPSNENDLLYWFDFASIEFLVGMWCVGEEEAVVDYENKQDVYVKMASKIFKKSMEEITKDERFIGKQVILSLQYGMGAKKFKENLLIHKPDIENDFEDLDVFCENALQVYHSTYPNIRSFHNTLMNSLKTAIYKPNEIIELSINELCKVSFVYDDETKKLRLYLPSGRYILFHNVKVEVSNGKYVFTALDFATRDFKEKYIKFYGGKLFNYIIQGTARDLLCHIINKENKNSIINLVHDEVVLELNEKDKAYVENLLTLKPDWFKPNIRCDLEFSKRYKQNN